MRLVIGFILGLIAAPLLFVLAAIMGLLPSNASSQPPNWESSVGMRAIDASLEKRSAHLQNPISGDNAALASGRKIYNENCAACHGNTTGPSNLGATSLYPRAPQFFQEGSDVTAPEAFAAIHDGIRYSGMGAWHNQLSDRQIWEVANFVASLHPKGAMAKDMD